MMPWGEATVSTVILMIMIMIIQPKSCKAQNNDHKSILGDLNGFSISDLGSLRPGNINSDIDDLLTRIKKNLPSVIKLDNVGNGFVQDCYLTGLDTGISRLGNATLEIPKTKSIFNFAFATNRIDVTCSWKTVIGFLVFIGNIGAHTDSVHVRARMALEIFPGAHPVLEDFQVTNMNPIKTDVSGTGVFDVLSEMILDMTASKYRDTIIREIENNVSRIIKNELKRFKLPSLF